MNRDDGSGFVGRWSRRKAEARHGVLEPERPPAAPAAAPRAAVPAASPAPATDDGAAAASPPPPTMEDVEALSPQAGDFSRFVAPRVAPDVQRAALKKLFADPHFNVMDGLDIYIDDYGKPDPLPQAMLRQLTQGRSLGLFGDEQATTPAAAGPSQAADTDQPPQPPTGRADDAGPPPDEDPDLQLQPQPAARPAGPEADAGGTGRGGD